VRSTHVGGGSICRFARTLLDLHIDSPSLPKLEPPTCTKRWGTRTSNSPGRRSFLEKKSVVERTIAEGAQVRKKWRRGGMPFLELERGKAKVASTVGYHELSRSSSSADDARELLRESGICRVYRHHINARPATSELAARSARDPRLANWLPDTLTPGPQCIAHDSSYRHSQVTQIVPGHLSGLAGRYQTACPRRRSTSKKRE
jgi:hypothetical protein